DINPIRKSSRTRRAPDRMCLYIDAEEHELVDLGEPANYKVALLDPESKKWLDAINVEIQSMKDNDVWVLVELPPNDRTIRSKWLFKKKTDMDGAVYIFKARLVAKGFTQTYGVDYEETFSPVADFRAIRILIAIAAYYDYEIWQMDVKTAFLNGHLSQEVYMEQPEGFVNPKYPNHQASRQWNKRFDDEIKKFGFTQNPDEPCVYIKASGSYIAILVLYVDDILLMGTNIPICEGSSAPLLAATLPDIVLDEECLVDRDLDNSVMGEVHHFSSLNNLRVLLYNEGFADVEIMYLGGLWNDFVANERIVWVDIEGVPLNAWTRNSFHKIGSKWEEVMDVEDSTNDMFARKILCIKTNLVHNILDSFKIIVKGKVFMVRAKELFVWSPSFKDVPEVTQCSEVSSFKNAADNNVEDIPDVNVEEESDCDAVSDTFFGDSEDVPVKENENNQSVNDKEVSKDPFSIYEIFNRSKKHHHIISDNFVALYGMWIPKKIQILIISIYAPQSLAAKRQLWDYIASLISQWRGECIVLGDFNEVRCKEERWGSTFHAQGAHRHLSDHRPIILREKLTDFGATPFRNGMIRFKKKLQCLKKEIRKWVADFKSVQSSSIKDIKKKLCDIDKVLDQGRVIDEVLLSRMETMKQLHDLNSSNNIDFVQKAKVRW
nr:retrotransposon protein, putative, Ty1-copia subclass [Tanacetum cinerariifolium]